MRKNRQIIALVLCLLLFLSAGALAAAFSDISGHWAEKSINDAAAAGYVDGYKDGTFRPENNVTRAEFTAMVNRIFGIHFADAVSYSDVSDGNWFYNDVGYAVYAKYIYGYEDNTFRPDRPITREEASVILSRIIPKDESQGLSGIMKFSDFNTISAWARDGVGLLYNKMYLMGYPNNSFQPQGRLTRAEAISILERILREETIVKSATRITNPNTTMQEIIFTGGITIDDSVGSQGTVSFDDSIILCPLELEGNVPHNIDFIDTKAVDVKQGKDGVWLYGSGRTEIARLTVAADTFISEWVLTGPGLIDVTVNAEDRVALHSLSDIKNLIVETAADINLETANVDTVTVNKASDIVIDDSHIGSLYVNPEQKNQTNLKILGKGTVGHLYANDNLRIFGTIFPAAITIDKGAIVFVDEDQVAYVKSISNIIKGEVRGVPKPLPAPTKLHLEGSADVGEDLYLKWTDTNVTGLKPDGASVKNYDVYYKYDSGARTEVGTIDPGVQSVNIKAYVEQSGSYEFFVVAKTDGTEWSDAEPASIVFERLTPPTYRSVTQVPNNKSIILEHSTAASLKIGRAPLSDPTNVTPLNITENNNQWTIIVDGYLTPETAVIFEASAVGKGLNDPDGIPELNSPMAKQSVGKLGTPGGFTVLANGEDGYTLDWTVLHEEQVVGTAAVIKHITGSETTAAFQHPEGLSESRLDFHVEDLVFGANEITASAKVTAEEGNVFWLDSAEGTQTVYRLEAPYNLDIAAGTFNLTWQTGNNPADTLYAIAIEKGGKEKMVIEDINGDSHDLGAAIYELGADGVYTIVVTATGSGGSIVIGNPVSAPYTLDVSARTLPVAAAKDIAYTPATGEDAAFIFWAVDSDYMITGYDVAVDGHAVATGVPGYRVDTALAAGVTSTVNITSLADSAPTLGYVNAEAEKDFTVFAPPVIAGFDAETNILSYDLSAPSNVAAEDYLLRIFVQAPGAPSATLLPGTVAIGTEGTYDLSAFIDSVNIAANIGNTYTFSLMAQGNNDNGADITTFDSGWGDGGNLSYVVPESANALDQLSDLQVNPVDSSKTMLRWAADGLVDHYLVTCSHGVYQNTKINNSELDITACLAEDEDHTFTFVAVPKDTDTYSPSTTRVVFSKLTAPSFTAITGTEATGYAINWTAVANATGYRYSDADIPAGENLAADVLSHAVTPEVAADTATVLALGTPYNTLVQPVAGTANFYRTSTAATQNFSRLAEPSGFAVGEALETDEYGEDVARQYLSWTDDVNAAGYLVEPVGKAPQTLTGGELTLPGNWIANGGGLDIAVTALSDADFVVNSLPATAAVKRAAAPTGVAVDDANYQMTWTTPGEYDDNYDMKITLEGITHLTQSGLTEMDAAGYDLVPLLYMLQAKNGQWGVWLRSSGNSGDLVLPSRWAPNTFIRWEGAEGVPLAVPTNLSFEPGDGTGTLTWEIANEDNIGGFIVKVGTDIIATGLATDTRSLEIPHSAFAVGEVNEVMVAAYPALINGYKTSTGTLNVNHYSAPQAVTFTPASSENLATLSWTASAPEGATYEIAVFNGDNTPYDGIAPVTSTETSYTMTAILAALNIEDNYGKTFKFGVRALDGTNEIGSNRAFSADYQVAAVDLPLMDEARIFYNSGAGEYYLEWEVGEKIASYSVIRTVGGSTTNQPDATITGSPAKALISLGALTGDGPYTFNITGKPSAANAGKYNPTTTVVHLARLGTVTFTGVTEATGGYDLNWDALDNAVEYSVKVGANPASTVSDNKFNFNIPGSSAASLDIAVTALAGIDATGQTGVRPDDTLVINLYLDSKTAQNQTVNKLAAPNNFSLSADNGGYLLDWDDVSDAASYAVALNAGISDTTAASEYYLAHYELNADNTVSVTALPAGTDLFTIPSDAGTFDVTKKAAPEDVALNGTILTWTGLTGETYTVHIWDLDAILREFAKLPIGDTPDFNALMAPVASLTGITADQADGLNLLEKLEGDTSYLVGIFTEGDLANAVVPSDTVYANPTEGHIVPILIEGLPASVDVAEVSVTVITGTSSFTVPYGANGINLYLPNGDYSLGVNLPDTSPVFWLADKNVTVDAHQPALVKLELHPVTLTLANGKAGTNEADIAINGDVLTVPGDAVMADDGKIPYRVDVLGANLLPGDYTAELTLAGGGPGYPKTFPVTVDDSQGFTETLTGNIYPDDPATDYVYTLTLTTANGVEVAKKIYTVTLGAIPVPEGGVIDWNDAETGNVDGSLSLADSSDKALTFSGTVAAYGDPATPQIGFVITPPAGSYPNAAYRINGGAWEAFVGENIVPVASLDDITVDVRWNGSERDALDTYTVSFTPDTVLADERASLPIEAMTLFGPHTPDGAYYLIWENSALVADYTAAYKSTPTADPIAAIGGITREAPAAGFAQLRLSEIATDTGEGPFVYILTAQPADANAYRPTATKVTVHRIGDGSITFTELAEPANTDGSYTLSGTYDGAGTLSAAASGVSAGEVTLAGEDWTLPVTFDPNLTGTVTVNASGDAITDTAQIVPAAKTPGTDGFVFALKGPSASQAVTKLDPPAFGELTADDSDPLHITYLLKWTGSGDSYSLALNDEAAASGLTIPEFTLRGSDYAAGDGINVKVAAHPADDDYFTVSSAPAVIADLLKKAMPIDVQLDDKTLTWSYGAASAFHVYLWKVVPAVPGDEVIGTLELVSRGDIAAGAPMSYTFDNGLFEPETGYVVGVSAARDLAASPSLLESDIVKMLTAGPARTPVVVEILKPDGTSLSDGEAGDTVITVTDPAASIAYQGGGVYVLLVPGAYEIGATLDDALADVYTVAAQNITVTESGPAKVTLQLGYQYTGAIKLEEENLTRADEEPKFNVSGTAATVTAGTTVNYDEGAKANILGAYITAPDEIAANSEAVFAVNGAPQGTVALNGNEFSFNVKVTDEVRLFEIKVVWASGRTEIYTIDASAAALEVPLPDAPTVALEKIGEFAYQLSWNLVDDATHYVVKKDGADFLTTNGAAAIISETGEYTVQAFNGTTAGNTATLTVTQQAPPAGLTIAQNGSDWELQFTGEADVDYEVWLGVDKVATINGVDGHNAHVLGTTEPVGGTTYSVRAATDTAASKMASGFVSTTYEAAPLYPVTVNVFDPEGNFVVGETVTITGSGSYSDTVTSAKGGNLALLPEGTYDFSVADAGIFGGVTVNDVAVNGSGSGVASVTLLLTHKNLGYLTDDSLVPGGPAGGSATGQYDADTKTITFSGEIRYALAGETGPGSPPQDGNYVGVKVNLPDAGTIDETNAYLEYTDHNGVLKKLTGWSSFGDHKSSGSGDDSYFIYYPKVTAPGQVFTFTVGWNEDQVETYTVQIDPAATLEAAPISAPVVPDAPTVALQKVGEFAYQLSWGPVDDATHYIAKKGMETILTTTGTTAIIDGIGAYTVQAYNGATEGETPADFTVEQQAPPSDLTITENGSNWELQFTGAANVDYEVWLGVDKVATINGVDGHNAYVLGTTEPVVGTTYSVRAAADMAANKIASPFASATYSVEPEAALYPVTVNVLDPMGNFVVGQEVTVADSGSYSDTVTSVNGGNLVLLPEEIYTFSVEEKAATPNALNGASVNDISVGPGGVASVTLNMAFASGSTLLPGSADIENGETGDVTVTSGSNVDLGVTPPNDTGCELNDLIYYTVNGIGDTVAFPDSGNMVLDTLTDLTESGIYVITVKWNENRTDTYTLNVTVSK